MGITAADELQHPPASDFLWRESLYFSFHDADGKIGGMTTIGILPNQNRAQGCAAIFLGGTSCLFFRSEDTLDSAQAGLCAVPGIRYEMPAALQKWRISVAAPFERTDPYQTRQDVGRATIPAGFAVRFEALSPVYEFPHDAFSRLTGAAQHYEQTGRVSGSVLVGEETYDIQGFGYRDHSWGIRDPSKAEGIAAICAQFGPQLTVNGVWAVKEDREVAAGYVSRQGSNIPIHDLQVAIETVPPAGFPKAAQATIGTADGQQVSLQAEILSVIPVLMDHGGDRLYRFECSARFRHGGQIGYGTVATTSRSAVAKAK